MKIEIIDFKLSLVEIVDFKLSLVDIVDFKLSLVGEMSLISDRFSCPFSSTCSRGTHWTSMS